MLFLALAGSWALPASARPPNVILLLSDEHRWQAMGATESPGLQTPTLDRLAREGVFFTHAISNYPLCAPYRAMQLTGKWPYRTGILGQPAVLSPGQWTMAQAFREAGYLTGYIGKWHLGSIKFLGEHGFDYFIIWEKTNQHWNSVFRRQGGARRQSTRYNAEVMTEQALAFILQNRAKPLFLLVSWNSPHSRFDDAPETKKALYKDPHVLVPRPNEPRERSLKAQAAYTGYHAHVSEIDDEVGQFIERLRTWGLLEDTIIIYTSDHGSMLGSHQLWGKEEPFEEAIRVPFLVYWKSHAVPRGVDALFSAVDVAPTVLGLAGLPIPADLDGKDFSPWVRGGRGPEPESAFLMSIRPKSATKTVFRGVRTRTHTYAVTEDGPWLLFDNITDPYQRTNLVWNVEHAQQRERLHAMVGKWLTLAHDPFPLPANNEPGP